MDKSKARSHSGVALGYQQEAVWLETPFPRFPVRRPQSAPQQYPGSLSGLDATSNDATSSKGGRVKATQPTLLEFDIPPSTAARTRKRNLTLTQVNSWVARQVAWIARRSHADRHSELFLYTQAAKLVEEVGELHAELLGRSNLHRKGKSQEFSQATLEAEIADVMICTLIVAQVAGVDLVKALIAKMDIVDDRTKAESRMNAV